MDGVMREDGSRFATKKELKAAVQARPAEVLLEFTSIFEQRSETPLDQLPGGRYTVVGPNPYTSRKWYATIELRGDGTTRVS